MKWQNQFQDVEALVQERQTVNHGWSAVRLFQK